MSTTEFGIAEQIETLKSALTVEQLASFLQVAAKTIYRHTKAGRIPSFKIGNAIRLDPKQIARWLRDRNRG